MVDIIALYTVCLHNIKRADDPSQEEEINKRDETLVNWYFDYELYSVGSGKNWCFRCCLYCRKITYCTCAGIIGITLSFDWSEPKNPDSAEDVAASERVLHCISGIFSDPVFGAGDYSDTLKTQLAHVCTALGFPNSSLPTFTASEIEQNKGDLIAE